MIIVGILIVSLISIAEAQAAPGQAITVSPGPDAFRSGATTTISFTLPDIINGNLVIMINNSEGRTVWSSYLPDQHAGPGSIAWNGRDNSGNQVPEGQYTVQLAVNNGAFGTRGWENGQLYYPAGIAINNTGYIYVADTNNGRVQVFDSHGNYLTQFGTLGAGDGQFSNAWSVAINSTGYVYVVDADSNCVKVFDTNGNYLTKLGSLGTGDGQFQHPLGVAINSTDYIYVADTSSHRIQVFDKDGKYMTQFGAHGWENGNFSLPYSVAFNSTDYVYVADTLNYRVQVFDSDGKYLARFGTWGTGDGQFRFPIDIAINSTGHVYVTDSDSDRVQVFGPDGKYLARFGTSGTGDGQFNTPIGVVADPRDNVYVVDSYNHRIQVFYSGVEGSAIVSVDDTAPVVQLVTGVSQNNGWYNVDVPCSLLVTDNPGGSGVDQARFSLDNLSWNDYTDTFTVTTEGLNIVYWNCTDKAGNSATGSQAIKIDKTPPVIAGGATTEPNSNGWYNHSVRVILTPSDALSGIYDENYVCDVNFTEEGYNTLFLGISDQAGNMGERTVTASIDMTAPVTSASLAGTLQDGVYISDVRITLTTNDSSLVTDNTSGVDYTEYRVNNGNWTRYTGPFTLGYTSTVYYRSMDLADNLEQEKPLSFTRIFLPPATISMDEMYGKPTATPTPTATPMTTATPAPTPITTPSVTPSPLAASPTPVGSPTAKPAETAQGSGYLLWLAFGGIAVIAIVAGGYLLFFRK